MIERRKYPRFQLKVNAKYKMMSDSDVFKLGKTKDISFKLGRTRNISAEGICFESEENFNKGVHVNLEVDLRDGMSPVCLVGEIRWSQQVREPGLKKKKFINGVKLIDMPRSDEGRFLKFYCDRMVAKLSDYLKM